MPQFVKLLSNVSASAKNGQIFYFFVLPPTSLIYYFQYLPIADLSPLLRPTIPTFVNKTYLDWWEGDYLFQIGAACCQRNHFDIAPIMNFTFGAEIRSNNDFKWDGIGITCLMNIGRQRIAVLCYGLFYSLFVFLTKCTLLDLRLGWV